MPDSISFINCMTRNIPGVEVKETESRKSFLEYQDDDADVDVNVAVE